MVISMSIFIEIFFALLIWGFNVVFIKSMSFNNAYFNLTFYKILICFFTVLCIMIYKKKKVDSNNIFVNCMIGFFMFYLNTVLTMSAQKFLEGTSIALINCLSGVINISICYVILKKRIQLSHINYIITVLLAIFISIQFDFRNINMGFVLMFLGLVSYNLGYVLMVKNDIKRDFSSLFVQLLFSFICLIVHSLFIDKPYVMNMNIIEIVLYIFVSGFGFVYIQNVYFKSMNIIGTIRTSQLFSLVPVFVYVLSLLLLNNDFDLNQFIALYIIVGAGLFICID